MTCPICGRLYCDCSPQERGQSTNDMVKDIYSPQISYQPNLTEKINEKKENNYTDKHYVRPKKQPGEKKK